MDTKKIDSCNIHMAITYFESVVQRLQNKHALPFSVIPTYPKTEKRQERKNCKHNKH